MKKSILMLTAAALVVSCTKTEMNEPNVDGVLIQAKPVHELVSGEVTRAPFIGNIGTGNELAAQVVTFATGTPATIHNGTMNFANTTDPVAYASVAAGTGKFADDTATPYTMYGLYPTGWTATAADATITFTGCEDLMVTATATTSAADVTAGTYPTLTFKHQLTKFIVKVQAANADAIAVWKDITAIAVEEEIPVYYANVATYDLATGEVTFTESTVTSMPFYAITTNVSTLVSTYTDNAFATVAAIEVPNATVSNIHPVGYTMMAPFVAKNDKDITLKVSASFDDGTGFGTVDKYIPLNVPLVPPAPVVGGTPVNLTTGYAYTITLTFTDKETIVATAEVVDWIEGEEIGGIVM